MVGDEGSGLMNTLSVCASVCVSLCEEEKKDEPDSYVTVTIDTKNKVTDHFSVHEKLGV